MNTKLIQNTFVKTLPNLPMLKANKMNRVVTKHFCNLVLYMEKNELALLTWLIYQTDIKNIFEYNSSLLRRYRQSIINANEEYGTKSDLKTSLIYIRYQLKKLIELGYVLPINEKKYIINPLLTFHPESLTTKKWHLISKMYESIGKTPEKWQIIEFTTRVMAQIADNKN